MSEMIPLNPEDAQLRARLQQAVRASAVPAGLHDRVRGAIRAEPRSRFAYHRLAFAATLAIAALGGAIAYQLGHLRLTSNSQESYITSVSSQVAGIMRAGLRDHIHCSVYRKYPKDAPTLDQFTQKLNPEYRALIPIVRKHVPANFRLMIAHECRHRGRKFIHLSLKDDNKLLSLVLAFKEPGESFRTEEMIPALQQAGIPIYRAGVQRFQIAAFESQGHLAYVISDLSKAENTQIMLAMASDVKSLLDRLGS